MLFKPTIVAAIALVCGLVSAIPTARQNTHTGDVTFYNGGGNLGACGTPINDNEFVVAVSSSFFHSFGDQTNGNPICGRQIQARTTDGKSVTVAVQDICPGCGADDLDVTPAAFDQLADQSVGRLHGVNWVLL